MSRVDKQKARDFIVDYSKSLCYKATCEGVKENPKRKRTTNVVVGSVEKAKYLLTAHYDTPPGMTRSFVRHQIIWSIILFLPAIICIVLLSCLVENPLWYNLGVLASYLFIVGVLLYILGFLGNSNESNVNDNSSGCITLFKFMDKLQNSKHKDEVAFVFFDNEEKGLVGSRLFFKKYKGIIKDKKLINFDCVGNGDTFVICGNNKEFKEELFKDFNNENLSIHTVLPKLYLLMSDEASFVNMQSVGIMVMFEKKGKRNKYYIKDIHSRFDVYLNEKYLDEIVTVLFKKFEREFVIA